jgi:hypothetical protein
MSERKDQGTTPEQGTSGEIGTLASSLKSMSEDERPDPWDLLGLRSEDLTDAERFRAQRMTETDPEAAEERFRAVTLASALSNLPNPSKGPTASQVLAKARKPSERRNMAVPLALLVGLVMGSGSILGWQGLPERGPVATPLVSQAVAYSVSLEAVALGEDGARRLGQDAVVRPADNVMFRMDAEGPGAVMLTEIDGAGRDRIVFPAVSVNNGEGGKTGVYLAYKPDYGLGMRSYTAWLCPSHLTKPDAKRCQADALTLTWRQ